MTTTTPPVDDFAADMQALEDLADAILTHPNHAGITKHANEVFLSWLTFRGRNEHGLTAAPTVVDRRAEPDENPDDAEQDEPPDDDAEEEAEEAEQEAEEAEEEAEEAEEEEDEPK